MINRIEIKNESKQKLNNHLGEAIKIILVLFLISFVAGFGTGFGMGIMNIDPESNIGQLITSILELIISGLFTFGMLSFFLKLSRGEDVTYKELFSKTDMFIKYIVTSLLVGIATVCGCILLIIPGIILVLGLSQTMYILIDNPNIGSIEAMKKSYKMMNGYKMEYFIFGLSFLGWIILGVFTLGILYIWLIPYMYLAQANFYNKIKEINEQKNLG